MRGRHRKPAAVREVEGNRSKRPIPDEPKGVGRPMAPEGLRPEEREVFYKTVRAMPDGIYSAADEAALEAFARYLVEYRSCCRQIAETGLLVRGADGPEIHPLIPIRDTAARMINKLGESLGLSPVARTRLTAPDAFKDDPLALLLGGVPDGTYTSPPRATRQ